MMSKSKVPQIRFKGFIGNWYEEEVQKYYPKIRNGFVGTATPFYREKGVLYLQGKNVKNGLITKNDYIYISKEFNEKQIKSQLCKNDIVMVQSGHVGECALITEEYENSNCHALLVLTPNENVHSMYVVNYFYTCYGKKLIQHIKTGSTIEHILSTDLKTVLLNFPSIQEQIKIGDYFQQLDKLLEQKEKKYQKLKQFKKAMLDKMFPKNGADIPEIRFKGFTGKWEEKRLGEICKFITKGTTPLDKSSTGTINYIKVENIHSSSGKISITSKITEEEHQNYLKRSQLQENDILFSIAGTLGRVSTISKDLLPANTNQALAIIRLNQGILNYITTYLKGNIVNRYIKQNPTIGAQPNLSLVQIENIQLLLPKEEEQKKIGNYFQKLDNQINLQQKELKKLKNIKKASLSKMFA